MKNNLLMPDGTLRRGKVSLSENLVLSPAEMIQMARQHKALAGFISPGSRTHAGLPLRGSVQAYYDQVIAAYGDEAQMKQRDALLAQLAGDQKNPELRKQIASIRLETFSNYLYSPALWMTQYADIINLKPEERPVVQRTTKQEIKVYAVGGDGAPRQVKVNLDPDETLIPLGFLTTDIVHYRKVDPYRGRVVDPALASIRMAMDMGNRLNFQMQRLLIGSGAAFFGPFTFTGKKANWTFVANSYLNTANLPSSNHVVVYNLDDPTVNTTKFGFAVLASIVDYAARWKGAFEDGVDLRPTGKILLPPSHIKEIASGIFPSGATRNKIADELMELGWFSVHYLGVDWVFEPDTTLDPDVRRCYPEFNKKPVKVYFKPELDEEKNSEGDFDYDTKNEEARYARRIFGAYYDNTQRPCAARFDYSGAN